MSRLQAWRAGLSGWLGGDVPIVPTSRIGGPVPWIIALMVALVVVGLAGALVMGELTRGASAEFDDRLLVQIVEADEAAREAQTQAAAAYLQSHPAVAEVRVVPEAELEALLEPWLGQGAVEGNVVPIPALLDVGLASSADAADVRDVAEGLLATAPAARTDRQADWLAPLLDVLGSLRLLALSVAAMLTAVALAAVWLAIRFALASNEQTVKIVHALGGDDGQIAGVFGRAVLPDALAGALAGAVLGGLALWLLATRFAALDAGLLAGGGLSVGDWFLLALVPAGAVLAAVLTARLTALTSLRKSL